jgi:molybdopterin synthase catalytic subunit
MFCKQNSPAGGQIETMASFLCEVLLTEEPLKQVDADSADAGAVIDFWGVVRPIEDGREIEGINYDAHHEMAEHQLKRIAEQATERFELKRVIIHHRTGLIAVGEASLFLRVASRHRKQGFQASQWIVDELKKKVPIWKRPQFRAVAGIVDAGTCSDDSKRTMGGPGSAIPATV